MEQGVTAKTFKLNCCPIVNLFKLTTEPISPDQRKFEYQIVPDVQRPYSTEVFSVEEAFRTSADAKSITKYEPFYSYRHTSVQDDRETAHGKRETFWMAHRRPSGAKNDQGVEIYLSLVDLSKRPVEPTTDALKVKILCTNRDLPSRLPFGNEQTGDFELAGSATVKRIVSLLKPTKTVRPPIGKGAFWRLISHMTLNYLSLTDQAPPGGLNRRLSPEQQEREEQFPGREAFKELLKLYNYAGTAHTEKQIEGILKVQGTRQFARVVSENGISFARGTRVELELDEDQFAGGGALLFSMVIEHFLALYASMNSFTQLSVRTKQRREPLKEWLPRAGQKILL